MDTEPGSLPYAKQKFYDAVYALLGTATIDRRLTSAASYLMLVQPRDLPAGTRDDFQKLKRKLTRIPLSSKTGLLLRPISEDDVENSPKRSLACSSSYWAGWLMTLVLLSSARSRYAEQVREHEG